MPSYVGRKPEDPDYGVGEHFFDADRLGLIDEQELTRRLLQTFGSPTYRPPRLPAVAMELMALSRDPDVEFDAIERLLEHDAMLAGEVMAIARSAAYAGRGPCVGLRQALVRLGLNKLNEVVMAAAMNLRVFRSKVFHAWMERLRLHSLTTAHICRFVSRYTPFEEEHVFLCGLLHDVGIAGAFLVLGESARHKPHPELAVLWPAIHAVHTRAGAKMIERWGLPAEISMIVGGHHELRVQGHDHPIAAVVCIAEALSLELDRGLMPVEREESPGGDDPVVVDPEPGVDQVSGLTGVLDTGVIDRTDPATLERAKHAIGVDENTLDLVRADTRDWIRAEQAGSAR